MDRREAIQRALELVEQETLKTTPAKTAGVVSGASNRGMVVLITGKGTDPYIMGPNGSKTPWDDATVVKEEINKACLDKN